MKKDQPAGFWNGLIRFGLFILIVAAMSGNTSVRMSMFGTSIPVAFLAIYLGIALMVFGVAFGLVAVIGARTRQVKELVAAATPNGTKN